MKPPSRKVARTGEDDVQSTSAEGQSASSAARSGASGASARSGTRAVSRPAASAAASRARASSASRRKRVAPIETGAETEEEQETTDSPSTSTNANHNKYCHFCQHVKVRASSMLACENQECCRRFCEHCLQTHLNEDVDPMSSDAWSLVDGKPFWHCPICRKKCCCSVAQCDENHRHCKAYRYRRRRAELATKRTAASSQASADKRSKKATASAPSRSANTKAGQLTPTLSRPTLSCGFVRAPTIDSPPFRAAATAPLSQAMVSRPRREATLKRKVYEEDEGEEEEEEEEQEEEEEEEEEIKTPNAEEMVQQMTTSAMTPMYRVAPQGMHDVRGDMWGAGSHPVEQGYRSDEEQDSMMLAGMYGSMSESMSNSDMGMGFGDELLLDDDHMGAAELDEARWLRRTYETVYNPVARQRALSALSGEASSSSARASSHHQYHHQPQLQAPPAWKKVHGNHIDKQLFPPTASNDAVQQHVKPSGNSLDMLHSSPAQQPKAPWMPEGATRQGGCTVMYSIV